MRSLRSHKALYWTALVLVLGLTAGTLGSSSLADNTPADDTPDEEPRPVDANDPLAEPITGDLVYPEPGDETGPLHPFDPPAPSASDLSIAALRRTSKPTSPQTRTTTGGRT